MGPLAPIYNRPGLWSDSLMVRARRVIRMFFRMPVFLLVTALAWASPTKADEVARTETLVIETTGGPLTLVVEIADTPALREKGLMFRESLGDDEGMLFDFHVTRSVTFWMRNTPLSLDLVFIRPDGTIAGIHHRATPYDDTLLPSPEPVRAVLEIRGGLAEHLGIRAGDRVRHGIFD